MPAESWRPRSSSLGSYFSCEYRAALDRAIHYGQIPRDDTPQDTKFADFGTLCHWRTQELINAEFAEGAEPPTAEQFNSACQLHGGDANVCRDMVERVAERAALRLATLGQSWLAETKWSTPSLSGHIDFLSRDHDIIVDLKTTSRKPNHQRIKPAHLIQMIAYWILSGRRARKAYVLYADTMKAGWTLMCPLDYTTNATQDLAAHVESYIAYLLSPRLSTDCVPHLGSHCSDEFCPHRARCKDMYVPPAGDLDETKDRVQSIITPGL